MLFLIHYVKNGHYKMLENKPYLLMDGLEAIAANFNGTENIFLGIKPYGFHGGNKIPFVAYPILLCEKLNILGKAPKFNFFVFINDWEQNGFDKSVTNIAEHPFNVLPRDTTFQFTKDDEHGGNIVNYWESVIMQQVYQIKKRFPEVSIRSVKNSSMRDNPIMKEVILKTIENPNLLGDILCYLGFPIKKEFPYSYCRPICPKCFSARTDVEIIKSDDLRIKCSDCGHTGIYNYHILYYWLYHKILALPRIKTYDIDLCISGLDHYLEKDFYSRNLLYKAYGINMKPTYILYTPALFGKNGLRMGKSRGNYEDVSTNVLIDLIKKNPNDMNLYLGR